MRKSWSKARLKIIWASSKLCISMSDVKTLFWSPIAFSFVYCMVRQMQEYSTLSTNFLVRLSFAVKRHHDHNNSYKGKHLIGVPYCFRGLAHYHHGRTWQHVGRQVGEASVCSTSWSTGNRKWSCVYTVPSLNIEDLKVYPTVTYFLQQGHTYFYEATPPNSATPSLWGSITFKHTHKHPP